MSQENVDLQAPTTSETKVYYFLDDNADPNTPIVMIVPVSPDEITLADFKEHFARNQLKCGQKVYQYYCKHLDPDLGGDVKSELTDPNAKLKKSSRGMFEIHLSSVNYGTLSRAGTLPRKGNHVIEREKRRRSAELDGLNYDFGNLPGPTSHVPSSRGTVFSRRAGEHLAEPYTSNSEDPYRFDESSKISGLSSSIYDPLPTHKIAQRRKPRNQRYRKAYVPSTKGSATESSMSSGQELERIVEVHLNLANYQYLGINVAGVEGNIFITAIFPNTAASADGKLEVGDQIVQVNNQSFQHISENEAVNLLKRAAATKKSVKIYVAKPPRSGGFDPLAEIASETLPLDISLWVQSAAQCSARDQHRRVMGIDDSQQSSVTFTEGTMHQGETDDEEERQLYEQRRHGIPRHVLEEQERRRENEQNEHQIILRSDMDAMKIVQAMARPNSGLPIKDRKWLKLPVPQAFIGKDLVNWLLENVEDLKDKKAAKNFASLLLEKGLICHYVSKHSFTETCYYVFGDVIIGARGAAESTQNSGGTLRAEATTEVTYVGSPAPGGGIRHLRNPLQTIPNRYADQIWPISPIANNPNEKNRAFRRTDCESTFTNDYASMVGVESALSYNVGINAGYNRHPPPNTPLSGGSTLIGNIPPPYPSPQNSEFTEFEDDDKRRILSH